MGDCGGVFWVGDFARLGLAGGVLFLVGDCGKGVFGLLSVGVTGRERFLLGDFGEGIDAFSSFRLEGGGAPFAMGLLQFVQTAMLLGTGAVAEGLWCGRISLLLLDTSLVIGLHPALAAREPRRELLVVGGIVVDC